MRNTVVLSLLLSIAALSHPAQAGYRLGYRLEAGVEDRYQASGLPLRLLVKASADETAKPFPGFGDGRLEFVLRKYDGATAEYADVLGGATLDSCRPDGEASVLPRSASASREIVIPPGEYLLTVRYHAAGPYRSCTGKQLDLWEGDLTSGEIRFLVPEPTGPDCDFWKWALNQHDCQRLAPDRIKETGEKLAYEQNFAYEVIRRFPRSSYAAYAYARPPVEDSFPQNAIPARRESDSSERKTLLRSVRRIEPSALPCRQPGPETVPAPASCSRYSREAFQKTMLSGGRAIVESHPTWPDLPHVKLKLALIELSLGFDQDAASLLKELAAAGFSKSAYAQELFDALNGK